MEKEKIKEMVSEIVAELDYDIWKELFHYEDNPDSVESLLKIAEKYINE